MKSTHVARANPRLIPIAAPDVLQEAVKRIAGRLETWARATRHKSGAPGYMLSDEVQLPKAGHPGFTRSVRIDIIGEAWHRDRRFVIGGYYIANVIQLTVQADNLRRWLGGESVNEMSRWTLRKELTEILAHEMTHAAEHSLRPSRGTYSGTPNSYQQWANDPREVRAQARLIWEQIRDDLDWNQELYEVDRAEGKEKGTLVEYLLRRSTEYEKMVKQMAPANIKKVERIIERELREAGINTEGKGAMRNPTKPTKTLERKNNGAYVTAFYGEDDGSWIARGHREWIVGFRKEYDWEAIPSMSSRNEWRNIMVEGATEHNNGFLKALRGIVGEYPEVAEFDIKFDGPWRKVRDVLVEGVERQVDLSTIRFLHGTSEKSWARIQREGLLPRSTSGTLAAYGATTSAPEGNPDAVYLTTQMTMARYAARDAARSQKSRPVVLEIVGIEPKLAVPDVDVRELTAEASLARIGAIGYMGVIAPGQIRSLGWATEEKEALRNPRGNALRNSVGAISDRFRFYTDAPIIGKSRGVAVVLEPNAGEWMVKVGVGDEWFVEIGSMYGGGNLRSRRAVAHVIEQTIPRDEWSQDAQTILDYWSGRESSGVFGDWPRPLAIDNTSLIWEWKVSGTSVDGGVNGSLYRWRSQLLMWRHAASDKFKARLIKSLPSNPKLDGFVSNLTWKVSGGDLWEWSHRFGTDFIDMAKELRARPLRGMKEAGVTMSMQSQIADDLEEVGRKICEADALFNAEHEARSERLTDLIEKASARCGLR